MRMGEVKRAGRGQGEEYRSLYRLGVAETHPIHEAHQSDRKQTQTPVTITRLLSQTQNTLFICDHNVHRTCILSLAHNQPHQANSRLKQPPSITLTAETQTAAAAISKLSQPLHSDILLTSCQPAVNASQANASVRHPRLLLSNTRVITTLVCKQYRTSRIAVDVIGLMEWPILYHKK